MTNEYKLNCYGIYQFNYIMKLCNINNNGENLPKDIAIISICNTYSTDNSIKHYFTVNNDRILNIDFDDIDPTDKCFNYCYKTEKEGFIILNSIIQKHLLDSQSDSIVKFILNNNGKKFWIHCFAGISRSKAVIKFIADNIKGYSLSDCPQWGNNESPNPYVLNKLTNSYKKIVNLS